MEVGIRITPDQVMFSTGALYIFADARHFVTSYLQLF